MISKTTFRCAALLALASSAQLSAAQAATCLNERDVHGLLAYALPSVAQTVVDKCGAQLPKAAYLTTRGPRLVADLRDGQSAAWPAAREAMVKMASDGGKDATMFGSMPESVVGPIMEQMIASKFTNGIKPENCRDIDHVLSTMAPLPAANVVDMLTAIVMIAGRNDKKLRTCTV